MVKKESALGRWMEALVAGRGLEGAGDKSRDRARELLEEVYAERAHAAQHERGRYQLRANLRQGDNDAAYAGIITEPNPTSGAYQGTSLVWFPAERGSVVVLVVGTAGFGADQELLGRPGHARRLRALARSHRGRIWVKPDLLDLAAKVPSVMWEVWPSVEAARKAYDAYVYAAFPVTSSADADLVEDLLDFFLTEHGTPLKGDAKTRWERRRAALRAHVFPRLDETAVRALLDERRFVVLEGPPGTGKTRLATRIADAIGSSTKIQFHPARTYEDFVVGLFPRPTAAGLAFEVRAGDLLRANARAREAAHVLLVDEINRADLSRVLGEAIVLFEAGDADREVELPHAPDGHPRTLRLDPKLRVLGTRNTADRTIARMDVAIRRRFAFLPVWPDRTPIEEQKISVALDAFDDCLDTFTEYADDETLKLVPGHAYFLDPRPDLPSDGRADRVANRLQHELLPLLQDYLSERMCGPADREIAGLVDRLQAKLDEAR